MPMSSCMGLLYRIAHLLGMLALRRLALLKPLTINSDQLRPSRSWYCSFTYWLCVPCLHHRLLVVWANCRLPKDSLETLQRKESSWREVHHTRIVGYKSTPQVTRSLIICLSISNKLNLLFTISYVGEVGIWTGVWALSIPALKANAPLLGNYAWLIAGVSPLMTYLLTRYVSGVPPLEVRSLSSWENLELPIEAISCLLLEIRPKEVWRWPQVEWIHAVCIQFREDPCMR